VTTWIITGITVVGIFVAISAWYAKQFREEEQQRAEREEVYRHVVAQQRKEEQ
jgi:hypothetical protein